MKRTFLHGSIGVLVGYAGLCAWLFFAQDKLLYFPTREVSASNAEVIRLNNGAESLKVWKVGDGSNAVLYFGGNGENVARSIARFDNLLPDTAVYLHNYRGYGGSSGEPSEAAFIADAGLLYDQLRDRHERISVIGRSLGSGVATWLAAHRPVDKVVLVTPYDSIEDVAESEYPFAPVSLILRDKFRSIDYVPNITSPVLVMIAENDLVIPHRHTMNLVGRFPLEQVTVRVMLGTTHNTISKTADYFAIIREFLSAPAGQPLDAAGDTTAIEL